MSESGKVVIVTGGTHGIGLGTTLGLAARGHRVVAFGLDSRQPGSTAESSVQSTRRQCRDEGLAVDVLEADVSDADAVAGVVQHCLDEYGQVDGLVNNAAVYPSGDVLETPRELWDRAIGVNLTGLYLTVSAVLPHMIAQGGGAIVNIASKAAWGQPRLFAYSASKGGVLAATFALAYDHRAQGIRANVIVPGLVRTGMTEQLGIDFSDSRYHSVAGRPTEPSDVAGAVAFLLSDDAATITGTVLNVNSFAGQGGSSSAGRSAPTPS